MLTKTFTVKGNRVLNCPKCFLSDHFGCFSADYSCRGPVLNRTASYESAALQTKQTDFNVHIFPSYSCLTLT